MLKIPLQPLTPYQRLTTQLGQTEVEITCVFNSLSGLFSLHVVDLEKKRRIEGIPLVLGQDLLAPYAWGLGSLFLVSLSVPRKEASLETLGVTTYLVWQEEGL